MDILESRCDMSLIELGNQILKDRKNNSMSQEQLCEGICSQAALSLIERGHSAPSLEIISKIALKLKRPLRFYLQYLIEDNINQTMMMAVKTIDDLFDKQKYDQILKITEKEIDKFNNTPHQRTWYQQYLLWARLIANYRTNRISFHEALARIKELLDQKYYLLNQNKYLYHRILNSIALIYGEQKDLKSALLYYNKALKNRNVLYEEESNLGLYIQRIYYNKTKTLYDMKCYEDSIHTAKEGIDIARCLESMSLLGNFYYYLGLSYESLGYSEQDIREVYRKAAFVFEFLNKKKYLEVLHSKKKNFIS